MSNIQHISTDNEKVQTIAGKVASLPDLIYNAEIELIDSIDKLEKAELTLKLKEAGEFLKAEGKTVKEKEALVDQATEPEQREVIAKEIDNLKKKAEFNKLNNQFTAARKAASLVEAMINSKL